MPYGRVELAYVGSGPSEQVKALARLRGRSFVLAVHDEVGAHFDSSFIDTAAATLRGPLECPPERSFWRTLVALLTRGCNPVMGFQRVIPSRGELAGSGQRTWGSTRFLRATQRGPTSTWTWINTSGTSRLLRLMTLPCWMRGCTGGWTLTLPVRSSGQALASGGVCGMCGLRGSLKSNCGGLLSAWTGAAAHRPWPICVCQIRRVHRREAFGCWMSSMWLPARQGGSGTGPVAPTCRTPSRRRESWSG